MPCARTKALREWLRMNGRVVEANNQVASCRQPVCDLVVFNLLFRLIMHWPIDKDGRVHVVVEKVGMGRASRN